MTNSLRSLRIILVALAAEAFALTFALFGLFAGPVDASSFGASGPMAERSQEAVGTHVAGDSKNALVLPATQLLSCDPGWLIAPSTGASGDNNLVAIAAITESDIWAVGHHQTCNAIGDCTLDPLAMHWNGLAWSVIPTPDWSPHYAFLTGVTAIATNDVWAVGYNDYLIQTLVLHWDGQSWQTVASPNGGTNGSRLYGVDALTANDIWAVGEYFDSDYYTHTLVERWDGTQWSVVPSPGPVTTIADLESVTALSATDAWAVGSYFDVSLGKHRTLTLNWDGSIWSIVSTPNVGTSSNFLRSVNGLGTNDVWAVGSVGSQIGNPDVDITLAIHWDGLEWSIVPSPSPGSSENYLYGITVLSAEQGSTDSTAWAVGYFRNAGEEYVPYSTLIEEWDGLAWSVVTSPNVATYDNRLNAVVALPGNTLWAAGYSAGFTDSPLTERYTEQVFADVPFSNTFYPYTHCLACRDVDTGYACGGVGEPCDPFNTPYFRPDTLITRDDLSHMVAGAAGFTEDPGQQRFEDVPPSHPYFAPINRMAVRGLIGGYPCGGPGEPCIAPDNRAYFRPNNHATRGQIAKIVSNGAGLSDPPIGQMFEDVPSDQTFYQWIQRLASLGVMGGYPCGQNQYEPCGPESKPYFRWQNDSTRGQVAKITSNTFFSNCQIPAR